MRSKFLLSFLVLSFLFVAFATIGIPQIAAAQVCNPSALDPGASCPPTATPPPTTPPVECVDGFPNPADDVCFPQIPPASGRPGTPLARTPWSPIQIGAHGCLAVYHSDQVLNSWNIFRLDFSPFPNSVSDNLSQTPAGTASIQPSRSNDGQWVAFTTDRDGGNWEIWLGKVDGSEQRRVTFNTATEWSPAFGPGNLLAFVSDRDGNWNLYMVDVSGDGTPMQLTSDPGADISPFWAPDGQSLYFMSNRDGDFEIYQVNINTLEVTQITDNTFQDIDPIASPDGTKIAWLRRGSLGLRELWIWDLTTDETRLLVDLPGSDANNAAFSPDSALIAFEGFRANTFDIYVVDVNTNVVKNVTRNSFITRAPAFRCDTRTILYHSNQVNGQNDIFQINPDPINADGPFNLEVRLTANQDAQIYVNDTPNDERGSNERSNN